MILAAYICGLIASGVCAYGLIAADPEPSIVEDTIIMVLLFIGAAAVPLAILVPLFDMLGG